MHARLFIICLRHISRNKTLFYLLKPFEQLWMHMRFRVVEANQIEGKGDHFGVPLVLLRNLIIRIDDAGQLPLNP